MWDIPSCYSSNSWCKKISLASKHSMKVDLGRCQEGSIHRRKKFLSGNLKPPPAKCFIGIIQYSLLAWSSRVPASLKRSNYFGTMKRKPSLSKMKCTSSPITDTSGVASSTIQEPKRRYILKMGSSSLGGDTTSNDSKFRASWPTTPTIIKTRKKERKKKLREGC